MQAEATFPPNINNMNIYSSILWYQFYINSIIKSLKCVWGCYGLFISKKVSQIYAIGNCLIYNSITSRLLTFSYIDSCTISDDNIHLCLICSRSILLGNRPKFGILNGFFCVDCQSYPPVIDDFSMAEKVAIACMYWVVFILKLRPSGAFNSATYFCIKGYAVLFLQNPALLLTPLSSQTLALHNVIHIIWVE